jgi:hypothetical protein
MPTMSAARSPDAHPEPVCPFAPATPAGRGAHRAVGRGRFHAIVLVVCGVVLALSALLQVRGQTQVAVPLWGVALPELCSWRRYLGLECPGCGLTRSFISLAHFDPLAAWRYNPAGVVLFAGMLFQFPYRALQLRRLARGVGEREAPVGLFVGWSVALVAVLLIQWGLKVAAGFSIFAT